MNNNQKAIFPGINYSYWFKNNNWEKRSSIQTMLSNLKNKNLIDEDITIANIKYRIQIEVEQYLITASENALLNAFINIQVWGGSSARIHRPKIIQNFLAHKKKYRNAVDLILKNEISHAFKYLNNEGKIEGLGLSFIPKHICYWSGKGIRIEGAPILDNVISKILYNKPVNNIDYDTFIIEMNVFSKSINMKPAEVEIALFSFAQNYWETNKTRTNKFRKVIEDNKDELVAISLI